MIPVYWCSSREIAIKVKDLSEETDILRFIRNLNVQVQRGHLPAWAYRKRGRVYEFNPRWWIAPEPQPSAPMGRLLRRVDRHHRILSGTVGIKR